jgi:hypothetical protein
METGDLVLARGLRDTRATLARWGRQPLPVLGSWVAGSVAISLMLLAAVLVIASVVKPDLGFSNAPKPPHGLDAGGILEVMGRNSLVLALHAVACIAGFIAGSSLPLSAARRSGISRVVHERARPIAFAWVIGVTSFSLVTQAFALGTTGSTLAEELQITPGQLILTVLPHALLELTAVFLPARGLDDRQPPERVGSAAGGDPGHGDDGGPDAAGLGELGGPRLALPPPGRPAGQLDRPPSARFRATPPI